MRITTANTSIVQLSERPDLLATVVRWIFDEWWAKKPGSRIEKLEDILEDHLVGDRVPLTLVALLDGEPAGTVSLVRKDFGVEERPETPWLAAVYTRPRCRHRGVAAALLNEAADTGRRIGLDAIWVMTAIPDFYQQQGWQVQERFYVDHPNDTILVDNLSRRV